MIMLRDLIHELRIHFARKAFLRNPSAMNHRRFTDLCRKRSAEQVKKMERGML